ncbi:adenosylcobinamide-phosphate synthase CbiB [Halohasta salina]|uniref:adenosylcobinamide-phosphate synthase CbiB n=1 Tax=Halohasta salina TaxID=2961621 RepID=UPI0020A4D585|nr:adenosylcobinamide-phosphate synthase CbiB [Halohasta salina]
MSVTLAAVVVAVGILDRLVGEPHARFHPVAWFGRLVALVDRAWGTPRLVGGLAALGFPLVAATVAGGTVAAAGRLGPIPAAAVAVGVLFSSTSLRLLTATAREVVDRAETDLPRAREELRALAGREASELSPELIRSAAVESAAENLADGLIAPLSAFGLAALAAPLAGWPTLPIAAAAAAWVKAVNTMDSMVGYRSKPVGWASARLDDLVMWLPARLTALLIAAAAGSPDPLFTGRRWARVPDSPNSGWPMAALAAAVGVRLEKPGTYTLNSMADLPTARDAHRGIGIVDRAGLLALGGWAVVLFA